jgi:hypothetical protein
MAKGLLLTHHDKRTNFYWNTHANVGPGCPNRIDDVQLVQLGYLCLASPAFPGLFSDDPAIVAMAAAINPGDPYSGGMTDPLTVMIRSHQVARGGPVDGRVSTIQSANGRYGGLTCMLVPLNTRIQESMMRFMSMWPKIHLHPRCPPQLAAISMAAFSLPAQPLV